MMQAMNTGHDGSISTVHANTPRDALARIENMILMASLDLPSRAIREQMASAIQVILQVSRFADGSRKLTHVSEVAGMEGQVVTMQDIFRFEQTGVDPEGRVRGVFRSTGIRPRFAEKFESLGISLAPNIFTGMAA
jgi:pilus assembly protein CpaF